MNEESFENLLEDYLNFEDYSEKYEEDLRNIKETTKTQKRFTFDKNVCITIDEFVNDYDVDLPDCEDDMEMEEWDDDDYFDDDEYFDEEDEK